MLLQELRNKSTHVSTGEISTGQSYKDLILMALEFDFDKAIEIDHSYSFAFLFRAVAKQEKHANQEAIADFNKAITLDPKNPECYFRRGTNSYDMGKYVDAINDYNEALKVDSTSSLAYYNRAIAHYTLNDYTSALNDYNQVIKLDPSNSLAYFNRADVKIRKGDNKGAIEDYTEVLRISPKNVLTYFNRGIIWQKIKNNRKAIDDYTAAINLNPIFASAYYNRAIARKDINDEKGSYLDFEKASQLSKTFSNKDNSDKLDSTGLAKLVEFRADFEDDSTFRPANSTRPDIVLMPNFMVYYSNYSKKINNYNETDFVANLNKSISEKHMFSIVKQEDSIFKNTPIIATDTTINSIASKTERYFSSAIAKYINQDYAGSMNDYNFILNENPNNAMAYFNRANTRYEMESMINTINDLDHSIIATDDLNSFSTTGKKKNTNKNTSLYKNVFSKFFI
jgi:tetratricopeptide (TPR) repeat protein